MTEYTIDGCFVEISLERVVVRWEETARGWCRFRGGPRPVAFKQVHVRLQSHSVEGQAAALEPAPVLWQNLEVGATQSLELAFEIRVPPAIGLGATANVVMIVLREEHWIPVVLARPVSLVPSRCFTDVLELAARLTGLQPDDWHPGPLGDGVRIALSPVPDEPRRVDGIELQLNRANGYVYGQLIVDPVNSGLLGALKNLAAADLVHFPLRFRQGDLQAASEQLAAHLRPYIDERGRLPIPSALDASGKQSSLPIPAGLGERSAETLPRAVQPAGEES